MTPLSIQLITDVINNLVAKKHNIIANEADGKINHKDAVKEIFRIQSMIDGIKIAVNAVMVGDALSEAFDKNNKCK